MFYNLVQQDSIVSSTMLWVSIGLRPLPTFIFKQGLPLFLHAEQEFGLLLELLHDLVGLDAVVLSLRRRHVVVLAILGLLPLLHELLVPEVAV